MKKLNLVWIALVMCTTLVAAPPAAYYTSAEGETGSDLRAALHTIIKNPSVLSYAGLWDFYKTADVKSNGKIWDMYSTCTFTPGNNQCGNYSKVCDCYNREHSIPKSWFGDRTPMYSDAFHLYPTDGYVNGHRSNWPFGECANGVTKGPEQLGKLGASTFSGYASIGTVFEPVDEYKGDFARTYFYMSTCYAGTNFNYTNEGITTFTSTTDLTAYAIALYLKWHREDPVSEKELNRVEAVANAQNNRNPFIDYPELAEYIWGTHKGDLWYTNSTAVEHVTFANLQVYPNPAKDVMTISADGLGDFTYQIFDISGQLLGDGVAKSGSLVPINQLSGGVYLLKIDADGKKQMVKLVVAK